MCICVNCRHIYKCQTYFFIEQQHNYCKKRHINFIPINNIIQINIKKNLNDIFFDWDLIECLSFVEKPASWLV